MIHPVCHSWLWPLALAATLAAGVAVAEPTLLVTVDVESTDSLPLPAQTAAICDDGRACGLRQIATMLHERHLAGTFFLDVYEYRSWGEPALRAIATDLLAADQDVGLHTHPQWSYDAERVYMYQYDAGEQARIVADGAALLTRWTGLPVVSHRAGAYSADPNTLQALALAGIVNDSSLFLGHPHSRLNGLGLPINLPSRIGAVMEYPVTVFRREERPDLLGGSAPPFETVRKFDVNSLIDEREASAALRAAIDAQLPYVVVFLHSYSFIARADERGRPVADRKAERVFATILDEAARAGLPFATMRELSGADAATAPSREVDSVPEISTVVPTHVYLYHQARRLAATALNSLPLGGVAALAIGLGVTALALRWRQRATGRASIADSAER